MLCYLLVGWFFVPRKCRGQVGQRSSVKIKQSRVGGVDS